jgi:hypothetical protein
MPGELTVLHAYILTKTMRCALAAYQDSYEEYLATSNIEIEALQD